jgi:hypothetical protein
LEVFEAMHFTPFVVIWSLLAVFVLGLALYRKFIAMHEDSLIHIGDGEDKMIPQQIEVTRKLDVVDYWGKLLTVVTVAAGLLLAAIYLFEAWQASTKID